MRHLTGTDHSKYMPVNGQRHAACDNNLMLTYHQGRSTAGAARDHHASVIAHSRLAQGGVLPMSSAPCTVVLQYSPWFVLFLANDGRWALWQAVLLDIPASRHTAMASSWVAQGGSIIHSGTSSSWPRQCNTSSNGRGTSCSAPCEGGCSAAVVISFATAEPAGVWLGVVHH